MTIGILTSLGEFISIVLEKTKKLNKKCQMIEVKTIIDFSCELLGLLINAGGLMKFSLTQKFAMMATLIAGLKVVQFSISQSCTVKVTSFSPQILISFSSCMKISLGKSFRRGKLFCGESYLF